VKERAMPEEPTFFRVCSTCRKEIGFEQTWYRCSVSTCNRGRTALFFCSVGCFSAHVPVVRHRDAWAEQERSPTRQAWIAQLEAEQSEPDAIARPAAPNEVIALQQVDERALPRDVLVVISKLKNYVRARSGFNTSDGVTEVLSDHLRELCKQAIRNAAMDGRKTVMDRDFRPLLQVHKT
jgi:histone H3/H4